MSLSQPIHCHWFIGGTKRHVPPGANPFALFVRAALMIKYVTMRLRSVSVAFRNVRSAKPDLPPITAISMQEIWVSQGNTALKARSYLNLLLST